MQLHRLWLEAGSQLQFRRTWKEIPVFEGLGHERVPNYLAGAGRAEQNTPNENELRLLSNADGMNLTEAEIPTERKPEPSDNYQEVILTVMDIPTGMGGERCDNDQRGQAAQSGKGDHQPDTI